MLELPAAGAGEDDRCRWSSPATGATGSAWSSTRSSASATCEVRPLDPRLGKVPNINSASVLEDGWPVLIVDVEDLVRSIDNLLGGRRLRTLAGDGGRRRREARGRSGSWSWTTRSPSASSSGSCWRAGATPSTSRSTASTAGTRSAAADTTWSSATSTCRGWTASSSSARSSRTRGCRSIPVVIVSYKDREEDRMRGPRRRRQRLPDQEQLPRPDVPRHGGRPDRRASSISRWPWFLFDSAVPHPPLRGTFSRREKVGILSFGRGGSPTQWGQAGGQGEGPEPPIRKSEKNRGFVLRVRPPGDQSGRLNADRVSPSGPS